MKRYLIAGALLVSLCGCGLFASSNSGPAAPANGASSPTAPSPAVSNKVLAAAYVTVQTIDQTALAMAQAGKLNKTDAANIAATSQAALAGLSAVSQMVVAGDGDGAAAKMQQVSAILTSVQTYLATRGVQK